MEVQDRDGGDRLPAGDLQDGQGPAVEACLVAALQQAAELAALCGSQF